ncbi:MAG: hypothetical protein CMF41_02345 [Legionellales bacterium]|nr:hypothetical protein [Legionellales bacterium]|tara:strand:+ start:2200 stop:2571 length:372 start_codon:yes stop_codon:yes gene_type:complete
MSTDIKKLLNPLSSFEFSGAIAAFENIISMPFNGYKDPFSSLVSRTSNNVITLSNYSKSSSAPQLTVSDSLDSSPVSNESYVENVDGPVSAAEIVASLAVTKKPTNAPGIDQMPFIPTPTPKF